MKPESFIEYVNDSKKISEKKRDKLYEQITNEAIAWSVAIVDEKEIDELNILNATKKALTIAVQNLETKPELILVDALKDINTLGIPYISITKGDENIYSISCASIIAKVTRDRIMQEYDIQYPQYGFAAHKRIWHGKTHTSNTRAWVMPNPQKNLHKKL
ncbi:MAG: ribonuclease HII [Oscillospiraceae bacterium]|nr:ribonuclease HII [Oscillospiraceae bacterium]